MQLYYKAENAELYLGSAELLDAIPDKSVSLILTDPPFGIKFQSHQRHEVFDVMEGDEYYSPSLMQHFLQEASRVLEDDGAIYIFAGWKTFGKLYSQVKEHFIMGNPIVWIDVNWSGGDLSGDWANRADVIVYGHRAGHVLRSGRPSNVVMFKRVPNKSLLHPAQKPLPLLEYIIQKSSDPGDIVLDPFAGSASTVLAAINTGRKGLGVEIDESWLKVAAGRLQTRTLPGMEVLERASADYCYDRSGKISS